MTRFMVAGVQRAGTTLIRTTLDSHPEIRCAGESFKVNNPRGKGYNGELGYLSYLSGSTGRKFGHYLRRGHTVRGYLDWLYATPGFRALGFKFMYNQSRRYPWVVDYAKTHEVRVIHVLRKNVFKKLISTLTARARGQFHSKEALKQVTRVEVPVRDLIGNLERIERESTRWREVFEGKAPYLQVVYEDYVASPAEYDQQMLSFLGVDASSLSSSLVKLNPDDLSKIIVNYDDVSTCLRNSRFAWCLG